MTDWKVYKGEGPWDFVAQPSKYGYLNNPGWSSIDTVINYDGRTDEPMIWPFTKFWPFTIPENSDNWTKK